MTPILVFDIETVPDIAGLRRVHAETAGLDDDAVLEWIAQARREKTGSDFLPLHFQKVVAIACALRDGGGIKIASVGNVDDTEPELVRRFFDLVDRHYAAARVVERRRFRPARAELPRADPRRDRRPVLGMG